MRHAHLRLLQNDMHTHTPPTPTPLTSFSSSKKLTWGNGQGGVKERFEKLTLHSNQNTLKNLEIFFYLFSLSQILKSSTFYD